MIGPGTGVSPFRGFLQHRAARAARDASARTAVCRGWWRPGVRFAGVASREDAELAPPLLLGPAHLFFGNRAPHTDFLYREDMLAALRDGSLSALHTAWSRDASPAGRAEAAAHGSGGKLYVQHRLAQHGREIAALLLVGAQRDGGGCGAQASAGALTDAGGAHIYVCGDGARMAKDVHAALVALLARHGPAVHAEALAAATPASPPAATVPLIASEAEAQDFLAALAKRGRYVRDIWS